MKMDIARNLLNLGAVKFSPQNPFTYASGLKGPIYCDNRTILSHVEFRDQVVVAFIDVIKQNKLSFDHLGGIATAGIPHAAIIADRLNSPMIYVRPKAKGHGKRNQVEGDFSKGQNVLLVEDLVNQGASLLEAVEGVRAEGLLCQFCLCIVDYQMQIASQRLSEHSIQLFSLTDFTSLSLAALELRLIDQEAFELLKSWQINPTLWSDKCST